MTRASSLRECREACHLTQAQVAEAMGVPEDCVSRIERGDIETMTIGLIRHYAAALGGRLVLAVELPDGRKMFLGGDAEVPPRTSRKSMRTPLGSWPSERCHLCG